MVAGGCGGPAGQALAQAFAQASAAGRGAAVAEAIAQADATAAQEVRRGTHCQSHPTADHNMHILARHMSQVSVAHDNGQRIIHGM
jgi:hypothetical protein